MQYTNSGQTLSQALGALLLQNVPKDVSQRSLQANLICADGTYYISCRVSSAGSGMGTATAFSSPIQTYSFHVTGGADAVLKKLGDPASMIQTKDISFDFSITAEGNTVTQNVETGVTPLSWGMISVNTQGSKPDEYLHKYRGWISNITANGTKLVFSCSANTNGQSHRFWGKVRVAYITE